MCSQTDMGTLYDSLVYGSGWGGVEEWWLRGVCELLRAVLGRDAGDIVALLGVASAGQAPETDEQDHEGRQDGERDPDAVDGDLYRATAHIHHGADGVGY